MLLSSIVASGEVSEWKGPSGVDKAVIFESKERGIYVCACTWTYLNHQTQGLVYKLEIPSPFQPVCKCTQVEQHSKHATWGILCSQPPILMKVAFLAYKSPVHYRCIVNANATLTTAFRIIAKTKGIWAWNRMLHLPQAAVNMKEPSLPKHQ